MSSGNRLGKIALLGGLVLTLVASISYWQLSAWANRPVPLTGEQMVEFRAGTTLSRLAKTLEEKSVISNSFLFYFWVRLTSPFERYQAGLYRFTGNISPGAVSDTILRGDIYHPIALQLAIPEGFTLKMLIDRLAARGIGKPEEIRALAHDSQLLTSLRVPSTSLEGYLYPATYSFTELPSARQVFELVVRTFWQNLPKNYEARVQEQGLTLNQAVAFASLIELETMHDEERPLVSEVIWRRLKDNMPIGIDASVIYGVADYQGNLRWVHLQDAKNPYNSRIHKGLPPTPIGSPSVKSLEAVLNPANKGYYYYVIIPGTTKHKFSKTLKEHNYHVRKLVNYSNQGAEKEKH